MGTPVKAAKRRFHRVATLVAACAVLLTGCDFSVYNLPLPGGADLGDNPYSVRVQFRDVLDLVPQSSVKVNDVTVGKVDEIKLDGYSAEVTVLVHGDVKLPDNAMAKIRQTSLLGEKFVSLEAPDTGASPNRLQDNDLIPLDRSGRNPEVEEVLGAMSLLLNGGGVAQLKTISVELGNALEGRESDVKGVLNQIDTFMGQLDKGKGDIIEAIESLNQLAISINKQKGSIELALDEMPAALASIDRQRDDLVRMLRALSNLSSVGTEVIRQSKASTITSLQQLDPILTKLAEAGDALPNALQVFLTYPFVDEVVGKNPQEARDLHMGDYTNLSVQLDIDLTKLPAPVQGAVDDLIEQCQDSPLAEVCDQLTLDQIREICAQTPLSPLCDQLPLPGGGGGPLPDNPLPGTDPGQQLTQADRCARAIRDGRPNARPCRRMDDQERAAFCENRDRPIFAAFCGTGTGGGNSNDDGGGGLPGVPEVPGVSRNRPATGMSWFEDKYSLRVPANATYDSTLGSLLLQGMAAR